MAAAKRSPSLETSSVEEGLELAQPHKTGVVLVRHSNEDDWTQRVFDFTPTSGLLTLRSEPGSRSLSVRLDPSTLQVRPSPFKLGQVPDSLVLHIFPLVRVRRKSNPRDEEVGEIHFTAVDRAAVLDWSYFFRNWISSEMHFVSLVPPLTPAEAAQSAQLLAGRNDPDDQLVIEKFNIRITLRTLSCLRPGEWLSDEVLNFYLALVQEAGKERKIFCWSTFFWTKLTSGSDQYNYAGVRSWAKKKDLFAFDLILVPLHMDKAHWALGVVDLRARTSQYLDSLGKLDCPLFHKFINRYLHDEHVREGGIGDVQSLTPAPPPQLPTQSNGSDCGVFLCLFALAIARGVRLDAVEEKQIPVMRRRIAVQIAGGVLR